MDTDDHIEQARRRYYITTAIDYPNAAPHIGHALEKVAADVLARYHRLLGDDTYFSGGIDENSQHVLTAAQKNGFAPQEWVDRMDAVFRLAWEKLGVGYDYWIRTTEERHFRASQEMFKRAREHGDIYKSTYSGWYCPNCNAFYTTEDLVDGRCPNHPTLVPDWLEEENYFFALSRYSASLLAHIEAHPEFIVPASRRAEVLGLLKQGLRDFSVSRQVRPQAPTWGVPVPDDPQQVIYVWFDALTNYLTTVGFPDDQQQFARYWPADAHVIGKDITRFHCLYWPAMLLSAGLPLPRQVAVHGFITLEGQRISKTLGNVVDPVAVVDAVGTDAVRFYLLRNLSFAADGDFSRTGLLQHYNDELGNDLGNLLNRVVSMIKRYRAGVVPRSEQPGAAEEEIQRLAEETRQRAGTALQAWEIGNALNITWNLVRRVNQYLERNAPWQLAKRPDQAARLDTVLYTAAEATRILAILLTPYIPGSCAKIMAQLGLDAIHAGDWAKHAQWGSVAFTQVAPGDVIFPRLELDVLAQV
ncbi:MAG TPA: methionine--tRNA ligase [Ktedonobacteraceae bacterium]|jgi:methionyl-tRNA synthetase|nr:methionine--tRNA ligase [Ktedonobacteraceae bacterium]